jgi:hypothetical protein
MAAAVLWAAYRRGCAAILRHRANIGLTLAASL